MNKFFLSVLAVMTLFVTACLSQIAPAGPAKADPMASASYQAVLGKSITDQEVVDLLVSNNCTSANQYQLCNEIGMALWVNSNQKIETVYLYLNKAEGFTSYRGELPYGLKFYDIMGAVEYKLRKQGVGNAGLPDESATPDHLHYWAMYKQVGMTIIYNTPYPDEDATIHSILVSK
jgi:hypothetical protein